MEVTRLQLFRQVKIGLVELVVAKFLLVAEHLQDKRLMHCLIRQCTVAFLCSRKPPILVLAQFQTRTHKQVGIFGLV